MAFIFRILYLGIALHTKNGHTEYILEFLLLSSKSISLFNNVFFNAVFLDGFSFFSASFFLFHSNITTSIAKVLGKRKCTSFLKSARKIQSVNNYFKYFVFVVRLLFFFRPRKHHIWKRNIFVGISWRFLRGREFGLVSLCRFLLSSSITDFI